MDEITVLQLIEILRDVKDFERIIVVSRDSEGNSYSPLGQLELGIYLEENKYRGEIHPDKVKIEGGKKAFIIYPSN